MPAAKTIVVEKDDVKYEVPQETLLTEILSVDEGTPDQWIPRHPKLIRLTGRHPLNCEPPPEYLVESGFITPNSLHYVRNHGAVIKGNWDSHRLEINGEVNTSKTFTMDEIVQLPTREFPCTLVCAGNRRKEENMVRQTIGFSWGPAGVSTAVWTGVRVSELLKMCGVTEPSKTRRYICFRGPKEELPKGDDGSYGTSIPLWMALDPGSDVILAYKMNGADLPPDHGYPIRLIVPGWIGGRMVKYIEEITVTEAPSDNYYHFFDNRILPPEIIDNDVAIKDGWWYDPNYIFNELNINSAVCKPPHGFLHPLRQPNVDLEGYAYTGGGCPITRVEISLDGGINWRLCDLKVYEKPNDYGKFWCWIFWKKRVTVQELLQSKEIICRAWDCKSNTQPLNITWNLMGMGNNCSYRVKVSLSYLESGHPAIKFEHPTEAGPQNSGGWMGNTPGGWVADPNAAEAPRAQKVEPTLKPSLSTPNLSQKIGKLFTIAEVAEHNTPDDCWIVVGDGVYSVPKDFQKVHPGGADSILINAGTDCTEEFMAIHSVKANEMLEDYRIGLLVGGSNVAQEFSEHSMHSTVSTNDSDSPTPMEPVSSLNPKKKKNFELIERIDVTHDTRIFRFGLPSSNHCLGLPVGKHIMLSARVDEKLIIRPYTPITLDDTLGHFDLLVKVYKQGAMTQYLENMKIGETIEARGPLGDVNYLSKSLYSLHTDTLRVANKMGLIAGGTGITPCYQFIKTIMEDPEDLTQVSLVFANRSAGDILMRDELEKLAKEHPERFQLWFTVDEKPKGKWDFDTGFITKEMLEKHLPKPDVDTHIFTCGPPAMLKFAVMPNLLDIGHSSENIVNF